MKDFFLLIQAMRANSSTVVRKRNGKKTVRRTTILPTLLSGIILGIAFGATPLSDSLSLLALGVESSMVAENFLFSMAFILLYSFLMNCSHIINNFFLIKEEAFLPLPIKSKKLFLARFLISFVYSYSSTFFCLVIPLVGLPIALHLDGGVTATLFFLSLFLTVGLFSAAFLFVNLIYAFLGKKAKQSTSTTLSIAFALASVLPLLVQTFLPLNLESVESTLSSLQGILSFAPALSWISFLPSSLLLSTPLSWLWTLLSYLICVLLFLAAFFGGSLLYDRNRLLEGKRKRKKKSRADALEREFAFQSRHPLLFVMKRELSNYRGRTGLVVNALSATLIVFFSMVITLASLAASDVFADMPSSLALLVFLSTLYFALYQPTFSYVSFSLEGTGILTLCSAPFRRRSFLLAKLVPGTVLSVLTGFVLLFSYGFVLRLDALSLVFSGLSLVSFCLVANLISLCLGIRFAQFSFDNAWELMRRGIGPTLSSLILFFLPVAALVVEVPLLLFVPSLPFLAPLSAFLVFLALVYPLYRLARHLLEKKLSDNLIL